MLSHYAPKTPLVLDQNEIDDEKTVAYLAFGDGDQAPAASMAVEDLSRAGNLDEAAHNLFAALIALDKTGADVILAAPIPNRGIGIAINDRLRRASQD